MQESFILSVSLKTGNLKTSIDAVLAEQVPNASNWRVASSFSDKEEAFIIFVRDLFPPPTNSPYRT